MSLLRWLDQTGVALTLRETLWLYPALEIAHLVGLAVLVGAAAMFDLRLLGVARRLPAHALAEYLLPWSRAGFGLVALSGLLLFSSDPVALSQNFAFQVEVALIGVAGLNIWVFHTWTAKSLEDWNLGETPLGAKVAGTLSLLVWTAIIAAGRMIAYV